MQSSFQHDTSWCLAMRVMWWYRQRVGNAEDRFHFRRKLPVEKPSKTCNGTNRKEEKEMRFNWHAQEIIDRHNAFRQIEESPRLSSVVSELRQRITQLAKENQELKKKLECQKDDLK